VWKGGWDKLTDSYGHSIGLEAHGPYLVHSHGPCEAFGVLDILVEKLLDSFAGGGHGS
jgi:hypothetical protein